MDRPARVQGEKVENPEADITSANFNIWWRKRIGQEEEENQREFVVYVFFVGFCGIH